MNSEHDIYLQCLWICNAGLTRQLMGLITMLIRYKKNTFTQTSHTPLKRLLSAFTVSFFMICGSTSSLANELASYQVKLTAAPQYLLLDGLVEASKAATVAAQTSGRILTLNYDVNDLVPQGAPLLEITSKSQGAEYSAAEAELAKAQAINQEAQAQFKRLATLFPQGAISQGAMDEAKARAETSQQAISAAQANLIKAKETLNYTVVNAPFSGRVTHRHVEQGETVSVGQALFSGYSTDSLRVLGQIPQRYYQQAQNQQAQKSPIFSVKIDAKNYPIDKSNVELMAFADPLTHSHELRLHLSNIDDLAENITPGQWLKVTLALKDKMGIQIPQSAILSRGELTSVYRIQGQGQDQKLILTQVRLGQVIGQEVQVQAGLIQGDVIALDAISALAKARIQKGEPDANQ
jgi:RND family efflux transporter MFP subunit